MSEKREKLNESLQKLDYLQNNLKTENISELENLIDEVQSFLSENHKARFSKLSFYEEKQEIDFDEMDDDLPF